MDLRLGKSFGTCLVTARELMRLPEDQRGLFLLQLTGRTQNASAVSCATAAGKFTGSAEITREMKETWSSGKAGDKYQLIDGLQESKEPLPALYHTRERRVSSLCRSRTPAFAELSCCSGAFQSPSSTKLGDREAKRRRNGD